MGDSVLVHGSRVHPVYVSKEFGNATTGNQTGLPQMPSVDLFGNTWVSIAKYEDYQWCSFHIAKSGERATTTRLQPPVKEISGKSSRRTISPNHIVKTIMCSVHAVEDDQPMQTLILWSGNEIIWSQPVGPFEKGKGKNLSWQVSLLAYNKAHTTLEFAEAPAFGNYNSVAFTGYDTDY